jgi:hypothetical protein
VCEIVVKTGRLFAVLSLGNTLTIGPVNISERLVPHLVVAQHSATLSAYLSTLTPDDQKTALRLIPKMLNLRLQDLVAVEAVVDVALACRTPHPSPLGLSTPLPRDPVERRVATSPRLALVLEPPTE